MGSGVADGERRTTADTQSPNFNFHFPQEVPFDHDHVYLELTGADLDYEARPGRLLVRIPVEVWEVMRHQAPADLRFADWTDEQIDAYVEQEVDERIREYHQHLEGAGRSDRMLMPSVCLGFGSAADPREQQLEAGREYFRELRDQQTQRKRRIEQLLAERRSSGSPTNPPGDLPG
jgi:hypothetical protein